MWLQPEVNDQYIDFGELLSTKHGKKEPLYMTAQVNDPNHSFDLNENIAIVPYKLVEETSQNRNDNLFLHLLCSVKVFVDDIHCQIKYIRQNGYQA